MKSEEARLVREKGSPQIAKITNPVEYIRRNVANPDRIDPINPIPRHNTGKDGGIIDGRNGSEVEKGRAISGPQSSLFANTSEVELEHRNSSPSKPPEKCCEENIPKRKKCNRNRKKSSMKEPGSNLSPERNRNLGSGQVPEHQNKEKCFGSDHAQGFSETGVSFVTHEVKGKASNVESSKGNTGGSGTRKCVVLPQVKENPTSITCLSKESTSLIQDQICENSGEATLMHIKASTTQHSEINPDGSQTIKRKGKRKKRSSKESQQSDISNCALANAKYSETCNVHEFQTEHSALAEANEDNAVRRDSKAILGQPQRLAQLTQDLSRSSGYEKPLKSNHSNFNSVNTLEGKEQTTNEVKKRNPQSMKTQTQPLSSEIRFSKENEGANQLIHNETPIPTSTFSVDMNEGQNDGQTKQTATIGSIEEHKISKECEGDDALDKVEKEPDLMKDFYRFSQFLSQQYQHLQLFHSKSHENAEKLKLQHIFVKKGPKANELEKRLIFLILYKDDSEVNDNLGEKLWQNIQEHQEKWISQLDGSTQELIKKGSYVLRSGGKVKMTHARVTFSKEENYKDSTLILIKDSRIIVEKGGYFYYDEKETVTACIPKGAKGVHHVLLPFDTLEGTHEYGHLMKGMRGPVGKCQLINLPKQTPRKFDHEGKNKFYLAGHQLDCLESGPSSSLVKRPCHEFKFMATKGLDEKTLLNKFIRETLRFACGCLNRRVNGTIHFGVVDEEHEKALVVESQPCEIVGIPLPNPVHFKTALGEHKMKSFSDAQFAAMCIHDPEFIEVRTESAQIHDRLSIPIKYVIEVDVEPKSDLTKGKIFSVKIPTVDSKGFGKDEIFERDEARTVSMSPKRIPIYQQQMKSYDIAREKEESLLGQEKSQGKEFDSTRKLKERLGTKHEKLDESFNRVLVISRFEQKTLTEVGLKNKFSFLGHIPFKAIIDFNEEEKCEGYQYALTEKTRFDVHKAEDYQNDDVLETVLDTPQFVFATDNSDTDWKKWRNSSKKRGLDQFTQQLTKAFPEGSVVIMFLIMPAFSEKESITFGHFCTHFSVNQVMFYVEEDVVAENWIESITRDYIEVPKALERGIRGLPWEQFQQVIEEIAASSRSGKIYIPISQDTLGSINKRNIDDRILNVVNAKECEELTKLLDNEEEHYKSLDRDEQNIFYQGQPVTWKNFWFKHVVKRDVVEELRDLIQGLTECMVEEITPDKIHVVKMFSCQGAGGSTAARHLLWILSREKPYRYICCIIKAIERKTADELLNFSKFNKMVGMPIVVLVDEFADVLLTSLIENIGKRLSGEEHDKRRFIFLAVKRSENPRSLERTWKNSVAITYDLSNKEKLQFTERFDKLKILHEALYPDDDFALYADNNLVSFMILLKPHKERRKFTKWLVQQSLPSLTRREKDMLTYLSLLHLHDPYPVFLSCFDALMIEYEIKHKKYTCNWTSAISPNAAKFLRDYDISEHAGTGRAIAITHPFLSEDILHWNFVEKEKTIAEIAIEFLESPLFGSDAARQYGHMRYMFDTVNIVLKRRRRTDEKIETKSRFSPLVEKILKSQDGKYVHKKLKKKDVDAASRLLEKGFDLFGDPVLAQQIARLYIHGILFHALESEEEEYLQKAHTFARKALGIKGKNSFFMDTIAQVYKCALKIKFHEGLKEATEIDVHKCKEAIDIAQEAFKWFRRSQDADQEGGGANKAGYFGEMDVIFYLLDIVSNCQVFQCTLKNDSCNLQRYLCDQNYIPCAIRNVWPREVHACIKNCKERYLACMAKVEERLSIFKLGKVKPIEDDFRDRDIRKYTSQYVTYFSSPDEHYPIDDKYDKREIKYIQNWNILNRNFQGFLFKAPFNINRRFYQMDSRGTMGPKERLAELKRLIEENLSLTEAYVLEDVLCKISVSMAMHSPCKFQLPKPRAIEEYFQVKTYVHALYDKRLEKNCRYEMYSYLLMMMFSWPHSQQEMCPSELSVQQFLQAHQLLRQQTEEQRGKQIVDDPEWHLYKKIKMMKTSLMATTLFFLGKGWGLDVYVHINEIMDPSIKDMDNKIMWETIKIRDRLKRLTGIYSLDGKINIETHPGGQSFYIEKASRKNHVHSRGKVTFYVGFSWRGAIAFDVRRVDEEVVIRPLTAYENSDESEEEDDRGSYSWFKIKLRRLQKKWDQAKSEVIFQPIFLLTIHKLYSTLFLGIERIDILPTKTFDIYAYYSKEN